MCGEPGASHKRGVFTIGAVGRCLAQHLARGTPLEPQCWELVMAAAPSVRTAVHTIRRMRRAPQYRRSANLDRSVETFAGRGAWVVECKCLSACLGVDGIAAKPNVHVSMCVRMMVWDVSAVASSANLARAKELQTAAAMHNQIRSRSS